MKAGNKKVGVRLRVVLEPDIAIGPGKADLLQNIKETGSIAAAGRRMGMSYKRAWHLLDTTNSCFASPLIEAVTGGKSGGGTRLTTLGEDVLSRYRRMEALTAAAVEGEMKALSRVLASTRRQPKAR